MDLFEKHKQISSADCGGSFEDAVGGPEWESCLASYSGGLESLFSPWPHHRI